MIYYYIITGVIDGEHYTKTVATDGGLQEAENMFNELVFKDIAAEYETEDFVDGEEGRLEFVRANFCTPWIICAGKSSSSITNIYGVGK